MQTKIETNIRKDIHLIPGVDFFDLQVYFILLFPTPYFLMEFMNVPFQYSIIPFLTYMIWAISFKIGKPAGYWNHFLRYLTRGKRLVNQNKNWIKITAVLIALISLFPSISNGQNLQDAIKWEESFKDANTQGGFNQFLRIIRMINTLMIWGGMIVTGIAVFNFINEKRWTHLYTALAGLILLILIPFIINRLLGIN